MIVTTSVIDNMIMTWWNRKIWYWYAINRKTSYIIAFVPTHLNRRVHDIENSKLMRLTHFINVQYLQADRARLNYILSEITIILLIWFCRNNQCPVFMGTVIRIFFLIWRSLFAFSAPSDLRNCVINCGSRFFTYKFWIHLMEWLWSDKLMK